MDTQPNNQVRILLTGGHAATPGIAVAEALKNSDKEIKLYWIGAKYAVPGSRATTLEYKMFPEIGVEFYPLIPGKLQTKFTRYTIPLLLGIPLSFIQAFWYVIRLKPKVIVSFGGFSSFPVIFWGWVMRIPVILHEQTVAAGRASIMSAFFARKILLSREESLKFFPKSKSEVTGNPLTSGILNVKPKGAPGKPGTILVFGGSRGSEFINEEVFKIIPDLRTKYRIIHITGERDFYKYKNSAGPGYKVLAEVDPREMPKYYDESDLIVARAGASTVSEIIYIKRPAILIPLPRTFMDEQYKNAKYAEDFGIAKVLSENEVKPESLMEIIERIFSGWEQIVKKVAGKESPDARASSKIAEIVKSFL